MTETNCSGWEWSPLSNSEVRVKKQDVYHSYPADKATVVNRPSAKTYEVEAVKPVLTMQVTGVK